MVSAVTCNIYEFWKTGRGHQTKITKVELDEVNIKLVKRGDCLWHIHGMWKGRGFIVARDELDAFMLLQKWIDNGAPISKEWKLAE